MFCKKVSCEKANLKVLRNFVEESLKSLQIAERESYSLVLAIDEVCMNLMQHSHQYNPSKHVQVTVMPVNEGIAFEITDFGECFDITKQSCPSSIEQIIRERRSGGMGLMIINRVMDIIQFERRNHFNVCRLYKKTR